MGLDVSGIEKVSGLGVPFFLLSYGTIRLEGDSGIVTASEATFFAEFKEKEERNWRQRRSEQIQRTGNFDPERPQSLMPFSRRGPITAGSYTCHPRIRLKGKAPKRGC